MPGAHGPGNAENDRAEASEVPKLQFIESLFSVGQDVSDAAVRVPQDMRRQMFHMIVQRQVPAVQAGPKFAEDAQDQFTDRVMHFFSVGQQSQPHNDVETDADVRVPQGTGEITGVMKTIQQERVQNRIVEQIVGMLVAQLHKNFVDAIQLILQEGISQRTVEQIVDALVPQVPEQPVQVANSVPQERVKQHASTVDVPVPVIMQVQAQAVQVARKSQTAQQMQKTVQSPQAHLTDTAMDIPVAHQRQVPTIQKVRRTVEAPKVHRRGPAKKYPNHSKHTEDKMVDGPCDQWKGRLQSSRMRVALQSVTTNWAAEPEEQIEHESKKRRGPRTN